MISKITIENDHIIEIIYTEIKTHFLTIINYYIFTKNYQYNTSACIDSAIAALLAAKMATNVFRFIKRYENYVKRS